MQYCYSLLHLADCRSIRSGAISHLTTMLNSHQIEAVSGHRAETGSQLSAYQHDLITNLVPGANGLSGFPPARKPPVPHRLEPLLSVPSSTRRRCHPAARPGLAAALFLSKAPAPSYPRRAGALRRRPAGVLTLACEPPGAGRGDGLSSGGPCAGGVVPGAGRSRRGLERAPGAGALDPPRRPAGLRARGAAHSERCCRTDARARVACAQPRES
jgi:hypothetical protein